MTFARAAVLTILVAAGIASAAMLNGREPPQRSHADIAGKPALEISDASAQLKHTSVVASLSAAHPPATSLLWCATFQIAWDQFIKVGGPLTLEGNPQTAVDLSATPFPANALDDASYVAKLGLGPATIETIKAELRQKFGSKASPSVLPSTSHVGPDDLVAYAYLFKNLAFETAFTKAPRGMTFGAATGPDEPRYRAFGIFDDTEKWSAVASQVTVWRYQSKDDFIIELKSREKQDRLIVARCKPAATLRETTLQATRAAQAKNPQPALKDDEIVMIPVLNFDITRSYKELTDIPATTATSPVISIASALQNIRFRLDEQGAVLKSDASMIAVTSEVGGNKPPPRIPREFVCNQPFLIMLQREGADTPYFAAWIDNPELLVKHK